MGREGLALTGAGGTGESDPRGRGDPGKGTKGFGVPRAEQGYLGRGARGRRGLVREGQRSYNHNWNWKITHVVKQGTVSSLLKHITAGVKQDPPPVAPCHLSCRLPRGSCPLEAGCKKGSCDPQCKPVAQHRHRNQATLGRCNRHKCKDRFSICQRHSCEVNHCSL